MKVALIGDVHANLPALEAALAHASRNRVEAIWNAGDMLGYGAFPEEVVERLRRENVVSIIGNYDQKVLQVKHKKDIWQKTKSPEKLFGFNWAYDQLSKESRDYLRGLPQELRLQVGGKNILLVHGSPASIKEHLTSDTPEKRLKELARKAKADVIICGHSHLPFVRQAEGVCFINPGSVGRPDDGDPRASYAIMNITGPSFQVKHYRVKYEVEREIEALREKGLPESFSRMARSGRSLEGLADETTTGVPAPPRPPVKDREACLGAVLELAELHNYEAAHCRQVTRLSLMLFDQLAALHGLGADELLLLESAGLLHDVGLEDGAGGHHKRSLEIIVSEPLAPFTSREQVIIGLIARYHRKVLPELSHEYYAALSAGDQRIVSILAAILRVADGLDRTHESLIETLAAEIANDEIKIKCGARGPAEEECFFGSEKGDLLRKVFERNLVIKCRPL